MTTLYRCYVADSSIHGDGITVWTTHGDLVNVDGRPYVQLHGGSLHPADGFVEDKTAAYAAAADRVEELGRLLLSQADRMRAGGES